MIQCIRAGLGGRCRIALTIAILHLCMNHLPAAGNIAWEGPVPSTNLNGARMVRVWLPPGHAADPARRFPVLYIHDGQNAFTTAGTNAAFGWGSWELDRIADELIRERRMEEVILVAIDCSAARYEEYRGPGRTWTPEELAAARRAPAAPGDDAAYRAYQRFLVDELKPRIDREYRTRPEPSRTAVMGASLGGICSLALARDRSDVFGGAASLSGSFQVENRELIRRLRRYPDPRADGTHESSRPGPPRSVRVYLDSGSCAGPRSDDGRTNTAAVARELRRLGWRDEVDLRHYVDAVPLDDAALERAGLRRDKGAEAKVSQHNEFYWRQRVWRALTFLFPPPAPSGVPPSGGGV